MIRPEHLALGPAPTAFAGDLVPLDDVERQHVARVLAAAGGNRTRAAEILRISRPRLRRIIEKYALE